MKKQRLLSLWLAGLAGSLLAAGELAAALPQPLPAKILYDNSGSMYPGYGQSSPSGERAPFFRQNPEFRRWLEDFARAQGTLGAERVGLEAFTSNAGSFRPGDLATLLQPAAPQDFDAGAFDRLGAESWGRWTYLAPALEAASRDFEGLVWLVTDNYPDSGVGSPDSEVGELFRSLARTERYRSVHLFAMPPLPGTPAASLAVYGILVADQAEPEELAEFDRRVREDLRRQDRPDGSPLFASREHMKLKDWRLDPLRLELRQGLEPQIFSAEETLAEGEPAALELPGVLRNLLTQYTVQGGRYRLAVAGGFVPDETARLELGATELPADLFEAAEGSIETIAPAGEMNFDQRLASRSPIEPRLGGVGAWLKTAWAGTRIVYDGRVALTIEGVEVRLEHDRLNQIFGLEQAAGIFGFEEKVALASQEESVPISFVVERENRRGLLFLIFGVPLLLLAAHLFRHLRQQVHFRVSIADQNEVVALRRLEARPIRFRQFLLGRLSRGWDGSTSFAPEMADAAVTVTAEKREGWYQVQLRDSGSVAPRAFALQIESLSKGRPAGVRSGLPAGPHAGPPGASPPGAGPSASGPPRSRRP